MTPCSKPRAAAILVAAAAVLAAATAADARDPAHRGAAPARAPRLAMIAVDVIRRVVMTHIRDVARCHEEALALDPTVEGRVVVRFTIASDGRVGASEPVDPEPRLQGVGACIAAAVRLWRFPTPGGDRTVTIVYPFNLLAPETGGPRRGGTTHP